LQAPAGNPAMGFHLEEICMSSYVGSIIRYWFDALSASAIANSVLAELSID